MKKPVHTALFAASLFLALPMLYTLWFSESRPDLVGKLYMSIMISLGLIALFWVLFIEGLPKSSSPSHDYKTQANPNTLPEGRQTDLPLLDHKNHLS